MTRTTPLSRRRLLTAGAAGLAAAPLAAPARAAGAVRWRMATAWPANLQGPGVSAARLAARVAELSEGRFEIELFPAGTLAPAFGVFDVVASGGVEMGHAAAAFWSGKRAAAPIFTAAPFGLAPWEHLSWIEAGGGQQAWDALYEEFGVTARLAGNTGPSMGGWFRREVHGPDDLKGLKMRVAGLGAEVFRALGVATQAIPPAEIVGALQSGVVDAAEFAGPAADRALGLETAAPFYYAPGFHEPNGASEALISRAARDALPADLALLLDAACREEHARGWAEAERLNALALRDLADGQRATLKRWPNVVLTAAAGAADGALETAAAADPASAAAVDSYRAALALSRKMARLTTAPYLTARG